MRAQQKQVGRFWFRFPTGESGADVYDRIKSWWTESILTVNERVGYDPVDAVVVITHSLTMRFVLMQLYSWSPFTFHSVWNAKPCDMYVLRRDLTKPGISPYVLDTVHGDTPASSVAVWVEMIKTTSDGKDDDNPTERHKATTVRKKFVLDDYLSVPPPRTVQTDIIKQRLRQQYPNEIPSIEAIQSISLVDEYDDELDGEEKDGGSGNSNDDGRTDDDATDDDATDEFLWRHHRRNDSSFLTTMMTEPPINASGLTNHAPIEQSFRWNCTPQKSNFDCSSDTSKQ
jgi:hypothetical protein